MEPCKQESAVQRLVKQIDGNGRPGLVHIVTEMSVKIDTLSTDVKEMSTNLNELLKFQSEYTGIEKHGLSSRQKAGLYISAILGVASIVISLIIKLV